MNYYYNFIIPKCSGGGFRIEKYKTWTIYNWQKILLKADIAVEVKSLDNSHLQRKPATKIILYAAAGLPIVCTPSAADKLIIEHGRTGYFAYNNDDWYVFLKKLVSDADLRKLIGLAGRQYVLDNFNIKNITQKYIDLFDQLK